MESESASFTILDGVDASGVAATLAGDRVRISPDALSDSLGWSLKPEGLCKGEVCVPVRDADALVKEEAIDLERFAELIGRPIVVDAAERVAALGTSAGQRGRAMTSLEAPDFSLPDLAGEMHTLSAQRGKKVLLIAYASW